jgi:hypothetical protein
VGDDRPAVRPAVEHLEARLVPAHVTYHGGAVISHVDLETVYWGQDWTTFYNFYDQVGLDNFASTIAQSSYLSMLGEYGVGRGNFGGHDVVAGSQAPANGATVTDDQILNMLYSEISHWNLHQSTGQQVYVVYLPPGVHSQHEESQLALGHHDSFTAWFPQWTPTALRWSQQTVPYIVVPDPATNPIWLIAEANGRIPWGFSDFQKQTEITSHELAEALTNPAHGGWYDSNPSDYLPNGNEIGDIANLDWTYLDGYVVQREWSNNFSRDIAPRVETWGSLYPYWYPYGGTSTSNGESGPGYRQGYVVWGLVAQYEWFLPNGSSSGWFAPD